MTNAHSRPKAASQDGGLFHRLITVRASDTRGLLRPNRLGSEHAVASHTPVPVYTRLRPGTLSHRIWRNPWHMVEQSRMAACEEFEPKSFSTRSVAGMMY